MAVSVLHSSNNYIIDDGSGRMLYYPSDNVEISTYGDDVIMVPTNSDARRGRVLKADYSDFLFPSGTSAEDVALKILNSKSSANSAMSDAFGRVRISSTGQRLDVEFLYDKQPDYFDEITNNGTVTFNANTRDLTLSLGNANNGSYAEMASHPVPYTPGNSQLIDITGVLDLTDIGNGNAEFFLRSSINGSVSEEAVDQSEWSNSYDGVDWATSQIFSIDFQSLKVGRIRYNLVQNGLPVNVGEIVNDNLRNSGYWQLASLPVYWKLYTSGGNTYMELGCGNNENAVGFRYVVSADASATMKAICCTVKSEGGLALQDIEGLPRSADRGVTAKSVSTTLVPILSIRSKSTFNSYDNLLLSIPKSYSVSATNPIRLVIYHNPTLTGASWTSAGTESCIEYDVSATAISDGHIVVSEYVTTTANNRANSKQGLLGKSLLWNRKGSETGILTIAAVRTGTSNADCLAAINWEEIR